MVHNKWTDFDHSEVSNQSLSSYRAWPDNEGSDPDLYMTVGDPEVSTTRYDWRSANIGPDRIEVTTSDPKFKAKMDEDGGPAYYFIGVLPFL